MTGSPRGPLLGRARHRFEELAWSSPSTARRLLTGDLAAIDAHRTSGRPPAFSDVERSEHSQNGEDGILSHLFELLDVHDGTFVEVAAADGEENCTRALAEHGWSGLWVEGDPELAAAAAALPVAGGLTVLNEFVDRDGIVALLGRAGIDRRFDLLSMDVDGNDYWLLERLLASFEPTVVVCEYNGAHRFDWVLPYDPGHRWDQSWRYGASLGAYTSLMERSGLRLVGCDSTGTNAFFVRGDRMPAGLSPGTAADHYVPPHHRPGTLGHPRLPRDERVPVPDLDPTALASVRFERATVVGGSTRPAGSSCLVLVDVVNGSDVELHSGGDHPVLVVPRILAADGTDVGPAEPLRSPLSSVVAPGARRPAGIDVRLPDEPGRYTVVPTLVQEHVAWREPVPAEGTAVVVVGQG